ncbi:MAG: PQQ-binding-like beta-propeller repeat protein [Planctomycetes bacterium]|nr:PQQ-binding-like beta-propeller repeat protein [Planctomycetota bacterium]
MIRPYCCIALLTVALAGGSTPLAIGDERSRGTIEVKFPSTDWPWWRGPSRDGVAPAGPSTAIVWSESKGIVWKTSVPGRGHGSPTVVGDQVVLATADEKEETQSVLCFARDSGDLQWSTEVHRGGLEKDANDKSSRASSTLACDGQRFFVNFLNQGFVHTTALNRDGTHAWQTEITPYVTHQGFGSSPAVYGRLVIVSADTKRGGVICGLDRETGNKVWTVSRPKKPNYVSPIILNVAGRDQLILTGCDLIASLDPLSGNKIWELEGATTECVTSAVTDGERVFSSGGYPSNHVQAVRADGSREVAWRNGVRVYVPSMIIRDDHIYAVTDAGIATCWKSATGDEVWKGRLGGTFSSSPVLAGEYIYATNEAGKTSVFKAQSSGFELVAQNQLGNEVFATPAICDGRIYLRVATRRAGKRSETLYCIAESTKR